jgi:glyoxylase-like metal-dependent hydrolase (beta-lactamase superfamily II)
MNGSLRTTKLADNIWSFNESVQTHGPQVDAYLITGSNRALVVDTLQEERNLYKAVRGITDLPVDVFITHGHPDHAGAATEDFYNAGCDIYMGEGDIPILRPGVIDPAWFKPLKPGMVFDLGGVKLETLFLPGHTPDSALLLDRENQILFTGDAIGAGVFWMQIPSALPLNVLMKGLRELWDQVKDMDKLIIHTGHRNQAPIQHDREFLADVILTTEKILSGEWKGVDKEMDYRFGNLQYRSVAYNYITDYCYNPENL